MLFLSEVKVDRGVEELKVVNLEKVDIKKVDGMEVGEEQIEQQEKISETEDGKDCFEGNQVSESSESLSQVMMMMKRG